MRPLSSMVASSVPVNHRSVLGPSVELIRRLPSLEITADDYCFRASSSAQCWDGTPPSPGEIGCPHGRCPPLAWDYIGNFLHLQPLSALFVLFFIKKWSSYRKGGCKITR